MLVISGKASNRTQRKALSLLRHLFELDDGPPLLRGYDFFVAEICFKVSQGISLLRSERIFDPLSLTSELILHCCTLPQTAPGDKVAGPESPPRAPARKLDPEWPPGQSHSCGVFHGYNEIGAWTTVLAVRQNGHTGHGPGSWAYAHATDRTTDTGISLQHSADWAIYRLPFDPLAIVGKALALGHTPLRPSGQLAPAHPSSRVPNVITGGRPAAPLPQCGHAPADPGGGYGQHT